jgi:DNA-binding Lrp family transcriptional regulator
MAMIRTNGFVPLRRGIQEHVANGSMSLNQLGIYALIVMNADPSTGIWKGSAGVISAFASQSPRTCRDAFETLEKAGYIKRFAVVGKHGSYPILVHRFECTDGAMKGMRLNAVETNDYRRPQYFSGHDGVDDSVNDGGNERVNDSATKNIDKKRRREITQLEIPEWVPRDSWEGFAEYRRRKGGFTQRAMKLTIDKLSMLRAKGQDPGAVLDQSVQRGWTGVFPIRAEFPFDNQQPRKKLKAVNE